MEKGYIKIKRPHPIPDYTHHLKSLDDRFWKNWIFFHLLTFYSTHNNEVLKDRIQKEKQRAFPRVEREIAKYIRLWLNNDQQFSFHFQADGEKTNDVDIEGNYDITISNSYWKNKDFYFECKNLDDSKDLIDKYVCYNTYRKASDNSNIFDGGVLRYFNGKYAQKSNFGGMIGFVLSGSVQDHKNAIIKRLNDKFTITPEGDLIKIVDNSIQENDFTFDSHHNRFDLEFVLHHILLNLS
ncbi:hypothetical protein [Pedobacter psychrotolerans]|uniref:hypothetical protein n=1 Tax=Pedobacter psychrotolerans TaxID=1843235 RepID=UPI003F966E14